MNDDQIDDLKQYITATVSQTEERLLGKLNSEISGVRAEVGGLRQEIREGFAGISEAIEGVNEHQAEQDTRLTNLESSQA